MPRPTTRTVILAAAVAAGCVESAYQEAKELTFNATTGTTEMTDASLTEDPFQRWGGVEETQSTTTDRETINATSDLQDDNRHGAGSGLGSRA